MGHAHNAGCMREETLVPLWGRPQLSRHDNFRKTLMSFMFCYSHCFAVEAACTDTVRLFVLVCLSVCLGRSVGRSFTGASTQDVNNAVPLGQNNRHHRWHADFSSVFKNLKTTAF